MTQIIAILFSCLWIFLSIFLYRKFVGERASIFDYIGVSGLGLIMACGVSLMVLIFWFLIEAAIG